MIKKLFSAGLLVLTFLLLKPESVLVAQTQEQIKQQAESKLKKMTPDEIEAKIRELGLTRIDAIQKAKELDISLESFLRQTISEKNMTELDTTGLSTSGYDSTQTLQRKVEFKKKPIKEIFKVPGFEGRTGITFDIQPYGYDMFQYSVSTFEPIVNVATPPSYLLGVGDEIVINVWGETKLYLLQTINKEGNLIIPDVGPIGAVGLTVQQLRDKLLKRMTAVYSSLRNGASDASSSLDVSLGKLKTIQVFVLGEAVKPGGYSLSSLSTIMHALYLSGGPSVTGSLREIQLKRDGKVFKTFDVYDYLAKADNSKDARLQDGDIVFIKPVGRRVAVLGNIFRPAIYELKPGEKFSDLLALSGGMLFNSYFNRIHVERVIPFDKRSEYQNNLLDLDLHFKSIDDLSKSNFDLEDGDILSTFKINDLFQNRVSIQGNVKKPGIYEFREGMKVKDVIVLADSFVTAAFSKGMIFRIMPNRKREVISFDPIKAISNDSENNFSLENEDSISVFKEKEFYPLRYVQIAGSVRKPGKYLREENLTLSDLLVMAGGLTEEASYEGIEISRVDTANIKIYTSTHKISLARDYWNNAGSQSYILKDLDYVFVPRDPKFGEVRIIGIFGEVNYPGYYTVQYAGEKISNIVKRAGGLRETAYPEGSLYYRSGGIGKIPLDMKRAIEEPDSPDNLVVDGGDSIIIRWRADIVYVKGEVYVPNPVIYKKGASINYYIQQAGGFTDEANRGAAVAFLPTGKKWESSWFILPDPDILPGTTVYVPKKIEKPDTTWPLVRDIVTTLSSVMAITVSLYIIYKQ